MGAYSNHGLPQHGAGGLTGKLVGEQRQGHRHRRRCHERTDLGEERGAGRPGSRAAQLMIQSFACSQVWSPVS